MMIFCAVIARVIIELGEHPGIIYILFIQSLSHVSANKEKQQFYINGVFGEYKDISEVKNIFILARTEGNLFQGNII